jgi:hypothetical protein
MIKKEDIFQFPTAHWILPFFACHRDFCFRYVDLLKKETGDYSFIKCVYGSPACKMNGGLLGREIPENEYLDELNEWNKRGISVWVTFSNYLATLKDLIHDEQSSNLLDNLNINNASYGVNNGVILANDVLIKYLKHRYPNLKLISSVIMQTLKDHPYSKEEYKPLEDIFDVICISHHHNDHILDWIEDFKDSKDKYEIMLNTHCMHYCKFIKRCYEWQCRKSLGIEKSKEDNEIFKYCPIVKQIEQNVLLPKELYTVPTYENLKKVVDAGFINLKLAGRHLDLGALKSVVYGWMLNIDYRDIVEKTLYEKHNPNDRKMTEGNLYFEKKWEK